jgi:hypothetical protein
MNPGLNPGLGVLRFGLWIIVAYMKNLTRRFSERPNQRAMEDETL